MQFRLLPCCPTMSQQSNGWTNSRCCDWPSPSSKSRPIFKVAKIIRKSGKKKKSLRFIPAGLCFRCPQKSIEFAFISLLLQYVCLFAFPLFPPILLTCPPSMASCAGAKTYANGRPTEMDRGMAVICELNWKKHFSLLPIGPTATEWPLCRAPVCQFAHPDWAGPEFVGAGQPSALLRLRRAVLWATCAESWNLN